jgi:hypothetical protein
MQDKRFEEIKLLINEDERARFSVLNNVYKKSLVKYNQSGLASDLRDWTKAKEALDQLLTKLINKYITKSELKQERTFKNVLEIEVYLKKEGFKISKTTLYEYAKTGILNRNIEGLFEKRKIDKFALQRLKRKETGKTVNEAAEKRNEREADAKAELIEIKLQNERMELEIKQKKYISKNDVDLALVSRAVFLDNALRGMLQVKAPYWVALVKGEDSMVSELIEDMDREYDKLMTEFASLKQFRLLIQDTIKGV